MPVRVPRIGIGEPETATRGLVRCAEGPSAAAEHFGGRLDSIGSVSLDILSFRADSMCDVCTEVFLSYLPVKMTSQMLSTTFTRACVPMKVLPSVLLLGANEHLSPRRVSACPHWRAQRFGAPEHI